jgi:DNA topoisomerase IB
MLTASNKFLKASETLANTRTVALSSYIHPAVIEAYEAGKLRTSLLRDPYGMA